MCGIFGAFSLEPLSSGCLDAPLAALRHRGPDGEGRWLSRDRKVALGHRRLAIIDRAGGKQPLTSEDGQVVAVVSGEFYGFAEIRQRLVAAGHRFRTGSDSEILVHLYEERGIDALAELRGEFAFLLWDLRRALGLAARDRFGVRPLVYAWIGGMLCFASEAKALLAAGATPGWDHESVFSASHMQYPPPDHTLFRGIRALEPGTLAIIERAELRIQRYWDLDHPRADALEIPAGNSEEDLVQEVAEALDEAVRVRLHSEVPIAFQLSGGLDSSSVVALAARHMPEPPVCFTVAFDRPGYDERALAQASADHVGAQLQVVQVSPQAIVDELDAAVTQAEGLAINGHICAKFIMAREIREAGFGVVLTGEGADEVFGGYAHLRRDLAASSGAHSHSVSELEARNQASAGLMLPTGEALDLSAVRGELGFTPSWMAAKATLGHRVRSLLHDDFLTEVRGRDPYAEFLSGMDVLGQLNGRARVHQSAYLWTKTALAGYILRTLGDGSEMSSSLEGRLPFLDHHLFERIRGLPIDLLIRGGTEKYILRRAVHKHVTPAVQKREKHPFLAPPLALTSAAKVQELLRSADLPGFIDAKRVRAALDRVASASPAQQRAWDPALMLVASFCILQRSYGL